MKRERQILKNLIAMGCLLALAILSLPTYSAEEEGESEDYIEAATLRQHLNPNELRLRSRTALVFDTRDEEMLFERDSDKQQPIASLTKLMTAMVIMDSGLPLDETIVIDREDRDRLRGSRSRLPYGTTLSRQDTLLIALAASENRAAAALARTFPGGKEEFVRAMNQKAESLGMTQTRFADSTGLDARNISTARDLVKMVKAAHEYPLIREMSTTAKNSVTDLRKGRQIAFYNTNQLVRRKQWDVDLSKTGYIAPAGHCLVMQTNIATRPLIIVLLNSWGKHSRFGDANRIKKWLMHTESKVLRRQQDHIASS